VPKLEKSVEAIVAGLQMQWLDFCETSGFPVPESSKVMMPILPVVYLKKVKISKEA